ncbi:MAG TPA: DUF5678 domain-containing protein [Vicinamibacteria bacterium]|nr:DUF5678 domain-containing protein [Vicinamibacteria bacterium]
MAAERTTLYLRGVPTRLVREAKAAAARRGSTLAALVSESLDRALLEQDGRGEPAGDELRESMRWYEGNRRDLLSRYEGEYIAVLDRAVLDHDRDFETLAARVFARLGVRPVFMPHVQEGEARARVRSPRRMRR